jgi:sugar/nucleoside kinase (ribokinase family)
MSDSIQLLGISNAIVDVLAHVEDNFLDEIGATPGSMTLIDRQRAREVYSMMGPATEKSGGSVANTVAGFANLGGTSAYIGRVHADQLGEIFNHDMRSLGVDVRLEAARDGAPTAHCQVLITTDGQRTMQTYLGACTELGTNDITDDPDRRLRLGHPGRAGPDAQGDRDRRAQRDDGRFVTLGLALCRTPPGLVRARGA